MQIKNDPNLTSSLATSDSALDPSNSVDLSTPARSNSIAPTQPKSGDGTSQLAKSTQKTHDQMIQVGLQEGEGLSNLKSRAFAQSFMGAEARNQDAISELLEGYGDQRLKSIQVSADEQTGGHAPNFTEHKADLKALFSL